MPHSCTQTAQTAQGLAPPETHPAYPAGMYPVTDKALWQARMRAWMRSDDRRCGWTHDDRGRRCFDWISDGTVRCRVVPTRDGWLHYCDRGQRGMQALRERDAHGPISFVPTSFQLGLYVPPPPQPVESWVEPA